MFRNQRTHRPLEDRGPLRTMFVITSMPVGGAETLLVELVRRLDRSRILPELCCLKQLGPLGEVLEREIPAHTGLLRNKYDLRVLPKLTSLLRQRKTDAVVTVGTGGDKMFWGRLAAYFAGVPVICSALHSTGLPDHVERLNRLLVPITDAFIGVAEPHGRYLAEHEGCPSAKVRVIPNGVDVDRFQPAPGNPKLRQQLGLPEGAPVAAIVAALRPEKNHELFLSAAAITLRESPNAQFLIIGDGALRPDLEAQTKRLGIVEHVHFLGTRSDVADILNLTDVAVLTSRMEANPVSILEAMSCEKPIVATRVGSIPETVRHDATGYLVTPGDAESIGARLIQLFSDPDHARAMGRSGREVVVKDWSIQRMIDGYQELIEDIYRAKCAKPLSAGSGDSQPESQAKNGCAL